MGNMSNTEFWLENLMGRDQFGRFRHRWKDYIKIDFREVIVCGGVD
jgi:hypothetical protein